MKGAVIEKMAALITAAFGLVAALAWNDAIKAIFKAVFGSAEQGEKVRLIANQQPPSRKVERAARRSLDIGVGQLYTTAIKASV